MSDPRIVASAKQAGGSASGGRVDSRPWAALGWVGLALLVVGGSDFVLVWLPPSFGTREWEFATVTQSFNGMPVVLLGIGLLTVASEQAERRWWMYVAAGAAAVLLLWVLAGVGLWASNVGLAMGTVPAELRVGIEKAVAKTAIQAVVYPLALGYLLRRAWVGWQRQRASEA